MKWPTSSSIKGTDFLPALENLQMSVAYAQGVALSNSELAYANDHTIIGIYSDYRTDMFFPKNVIKQRVYFLRNQHNANTIEAETIDGNRFMADITQIFQYNLPKTLLLGIAKKDAMLLSNNSVNRLYFSQKEKPKISAEEQKKHLDRLKTPVVTDILNTDFSNPTSYYTCFASFLKKGIFHTNGSFIEYYSYEQDTVCNILKEDIDNEDIMMYLPKMFVNYAGYDDEFVRQYINAIECFTGYPVPLLDNSATFANPLTLNMNPDIPIENLFYKIQLSGNMPYMMRYFIFFALRQLYVTECNNLPGLIMQIMSSGFDFLRSFLLANFICNNAIFSLALEQVDPNNTYYINPNTDKKEFFKNIKERQLLSSAGVLLKLTMPDTISILSLIKKKKFEEAFDYFKRLPEIEGPVKNYFTKTKNKFKNNHSDKLQYHSFNSFGTTGNTAVGIAPSNNPEPPFLKLQNIVSEEKIDEFEISVNKKPEHLNLDARIIAWRAKHKELSKLSPKELVFYQALIKRLQTQIVMVIGSPTPSKYKADKMERIKKDLSALKQLKDVDYVDATTKLFVVEEVAKLTKKISSYNF